MKTLSILAFSASLLLSISSLAADSAGDTAEKRSIGEFVSPDGSIDIDAVRKSGYQGTLDLDGFDVLIDPKTGEPLVQVSASSESPADSNDIYWDNSISPSPPGVDGTIHALAVYDSNLVAAGEFTAAGGVSARNIASWDGTSWSALGAGMNDTVFVLTVYDNQLIAGGIFITAGGVTATYIASWDDTSWSALGSGSNSSVRSLTVYDNTLIAGGEFTTAGNKITGYLAQWTKGSFICGDVNNDGTPSTVLDLTYLIDDIFRGGPAATFPQSADLNGDGTPATILDLTFMVDDIFRGGPAPTCGL